MSSEEEKGGKERYIFETKGGWNVVEWNGR